MIQLRDSEDIGIPLLNVRLGINGQTVDEAYDDKFTDYAGNTAWPNPLPSQSGYNLYINYRNVLDEYESVSAWVDSITDPKSASSNVELVKDDPQASSFDIRIKLIEEPKPIQDLHRLGDTFRTEDGLEWKMRFGSNFLLAQMVAEGIDIKPFLYSGLNGYRIFCTSYNPSLQAGYKAFHPDNYPNWLNAIGDTLSILNANGLGAQLDLICDNNYFGKDDSFLRNLLRQVDDVANHHKCILGSLGNENFKNGFNADNFAKPTGNTMWACGSGGSGDAAPLSNGKPWNTQRQHLRRDEKLYIDIPPIDAPTYSLDHMILFDETIGYADFNSEQPKRTNNADMAYKMGRIMSAFNGGCIHLHSGGHSLLLGAQEAFCKDEFVRAFTGE